MDALAEIRRAAAMRYAKVPQAERPHLRLCDQCKKPIYDTKVCPVTGRYHIVDEKNTLRIGTALFGNERKVVEGKELMAAFEANRIRWQEARTRKVRLDRDSAEIFQSFTLSRNWQLMRYGILYGTVEAVAVEKNPAAKDSVENGKDGTSSVVSVAPVKQSIVTVHSIFEPSQHGDEKSFTTENPDAKEERADAVAAAFGLVRVGIICTHAPRDKASIPLSSTELIACAREQSRFGDHCVIVTVGPAIDQNNQITADAWQATEQAVTLYRAGLIDVCDQSQQYIQSTEPLEVVLAAEERDPSSGKAKPPKSMEPSHFVDTKWLTGYIAIEAYHSSVFSNRFARYDRPGELPLTLQNVKAFLNAPARASLPFADKIRDFHLLVFLAITDVFDIKSDMPALIGALVALKEEGGGGAKNATALTTVRGFEELLNGFIQASR